MLDISCLFSLLVKSEVKVVQLCPTLCHPKDYTVHGILQARILEWVAFPSSRASSQPRNWTQVSHIAGRFFTSWATREAQEYWSGSLSLLQQIFPTQELNQDLLHCRLNKNSLTILGWTSKMICTSLGLKFSRVLLYLFRKLTWSLYPEVIKPSKLNSHKFKFMRLLERKKQTTMDT